MELQTKQPPELEFSIPEVEESLTAYLSAIGGAIIGLLLTLLVLAIDALGERLILLEQESGAVAALQKSLSELDTRLAELDRTLSDQGIQLSQLDTAVEDLQVTRRNFDLFTAALTDALAQMETGATAGQSDSGGAAQRIRSAPPTTSASRADDRQTSDSKASTTETASQASDTAQPLPQPAVVVSEKVAPDALLVYLFLDGNADGLFDDDENLIAGATVTLTSPDGRAVAAENSVGSAGTLFEELNGGEFTVAVDEVQGYTLASLNSTTVDVDPEASAGQIVYFAVITTAGD